MTLIVALRCADGVILSADSQSTEGTGNVKSPTDKIRTLTDHAVWSASGSGQIGAELGSQFKGFKEEHPRFMAQALVDRAKPILQRHYGNFIEAVPGVPPGSPGMWILAAGMSPDESGGPWITEVDPHCQYSQYEERGYHAIGSGAEAAQYALSVLSHFSVRENPLEYGKVVVCRVMDTIIDTAAYFLSQPVRIWTVNREGVISVSEEEMTKLRSAVETWKELERDALISVLSGQTTSAFQDQASPPEPM